MFAASCYICYIYIYICYISITVKQTEKIPKHMEHNFFLYFFFKVDVICLYHGRTFLVLQKNGLADLNMLEEIIGFCPALTFT